MRAFLSVFLIRVKTGLQYRTAALAGLSTQFFWGFMLIMIYGAFYEGAGTQPIAYGQLVTFTWLRQAFLYLTALWIHDREIISLIETGGIAYELVRPQGLYSLWFFKMAGMRISGAMLRFLPIVTVCFFLPEPYNMQLPDSVAAFAMFAAALVAGMCIAVCLLLLIYMTGFYTVSVNGIINIVLILSDFFTGMFVPIALMPDWFQKLSYNMPFAYVGDFPYRLYTGNIAGIEALRGFLVAGLWIVLIVAAGNVVLRHGVKKVVSQGG